MILEITRRPFLRNKFLFNIRFLILLLLFYIIFYSTGTIHTNLLKRLIKEKKSKKKDQVFGYNFTD